MHDFTVLDAETYFDSEYSLKKMTTESYIRDPRFKIHCVAIASTSGERKVFTDNFRENLAPYMDRFIIAQKAQFDGLILSHHLGLYPKYWGCTLSMARQQLQNLDRHSLEALARHYGLPEKTIDYEAFKGVENPGPEVMQMLTDGCLHDAELTLDIANRLLADFPPEDLLIIDQTVRLFVEPVLELDVPRAQAELDMIRKRKAEALEYLGLTKEDLHSAKKFSDLLQQCGVEVPMKISPTKPIKKDKKTGEESTNWIPALAKTDEAMKALLEHDNEIVCALAAARLDQKSTLMETRCERLIGMQMGGGNLPVYLNYHGAHTGRYSGGDKVNFQNFTRKSEIRKAIKAPEGYKIVKADAAQVECRVLNYFCEQNDIVEAFRAGRDIYCENATKFFDRPITKENFDERQFGKEIELACGYNMGHLKFITRVLQKFGKKLSEADGRRAVSVYRTGHPRVVNMWGVIDDIMRSMPIVDPIEIKCIRIEGYKIFMPDGTFLDYTGLETDADGDMWIGKTKIYGGKVVENIIQKLAFMIVKNTMVNIYDKYQYKFANNEHDALAYVVPKDCTEALDNVIMELKTPPWWCADAPLNAEGSEGETYDK